MGKISHLGIGTFATTEQLLFTTNDPEAVPNRLQSSEHSEEASKGNPWGAGGDGSNRMMKIVKERWERKARDEKRIAIMTRRTRCCTTRGVVTSESQIMVSQWGRMARLKGPNMARGGCIAYLKIYKPIRAI